MFSPVSTVSKEKVADFFGHVKFDEDEDILIDQHETFHNILTNIQLEKELTHLILGENYLTCEQIELLAQNIKEHQNLRVLDLTRNGKPIDIAAISSLKKIIADHPALEKLILDHSVAFDEELMALVNDNSQDFNDRLKKIEISITGNVFSCKGLQAAVQCLSHSSARKIIQTCKMKSSVNDFVKENKKMLIFSKQGHSPLVMGGTGSAFTSYEIIQLAKKENRNKL